MPVPKDPEKYEEYRRKRSEIRKRQGATFAGRKHSDEAKAKMSAAKQGKQPPITGKHHSDEAKAKMSGVKKGKPSGRKGEKRSKPAWNKAIPRSEEQKAAISAANKGRQPSAEEIERMAATKRGVPLSDTHKSKLREINKGRVPPTKGKVYTEEEKARIYANVYGNTWSRGHKMPDHVKEILQSPESRAKSVEAHKAIFNALSPEEQYVRLEKWIKAGRAKNNSKLEQFVAAQLDAVGLTYERQKRIGRYAVDFFVPDFNLIIEANGCYWHGCEVCGFNSAEHIEKRKRDLVRTEFLMSRGYIVHIVWEHEAREDEQKQT